MCIRDRFDKGKHAPPPDLWAVYKLNLLCELVGADTEHPANTETLESGWFSVEQLPPLSLGRNLPEQVRRLVELARHPELGVDVD